MVICVCVSVKCVCVCVCKGLLKSKGERVAARGGQKEGRAAEDEVEIWRVCLCVRVCAGEMCQMHKHATW